MKALTVALLLSALIPCAALAQMLNLVQNPGFEEVAAGGGPAPWSGDPAVYTAVGAPVHSGDRALQYVNDNPKRYVMCSQTLPLVAGKSYELNGWIKTDNIVGADNGATLCLEWYDAGGNYLGGHYPSGFKGTGDWKQLKSVSGRVPERAARCHVLCYVRKDMIGRAWFDDIEVGQWVGPPLRAMLLDPNYRGIVRPDQKLIQAVAQLELDDYDLKPADVVVRTDLIRTADGAIVDRRRVVPAGPEVYLEIPLAGPFRAAGYGGKDGRDLWLATDGGKRPSTGGEVTTEGPLPPGAYNLRVSLERAGTLAPLGSDEWRVRVPADDERKGLPSYVDECNRLIRDGKPFFPLGMYWSGVSEADLKVYADSAFNCLMPYGSPTAEQMDLVAKYGLKVIYSVKDIYVGSTWCPKDIKTQEDERAYIEAKAKAFGNHPALLAWYLNDELPLEYMPRLEAHQQWLEELDPGHPTWVVLYQVGQLEHYRKTCDVLGTDPYPIPGAARRAADWTRQSTASVMGRRPVWMVPQVFNWAAYGKTDEEKRAKFPPTLPEMRSMAWQCIVEGAKGLIFYSFMDLKRDVVVPFDKQWPLVKQMAAEIGPMIPAIMSIEQAPKATVTGTREWLHFTTRRLGDRAYLIAVNDEGKPHKAVFRMSSMTSDAHLKLGEGEWRMLAGGGIEANFAPHGVMIFELSR
jgi:hypothetical protein